jgi:hypothetical protein
VRALATDFDVAFAGDSDDSGEAARIRGHPRGYVAGLGAIACGRRYGRGSSIKAYTTFACGFRVSPQASRLFGTRHLELDHGRATCAHLQHLTHKYR